MKSVSALAIFFLMFTGTIFSQVPQFTNYQGLLTDNSGVPLATDTYNLTFRIYDVETGGSAIWTETQSVDVNDGLFNVKLGAASAISLPFDKPYWLSIQVESETELDPRVELTTSPYSFKSINTDQIKGMNISSTPPAAGQVLKWNGTEWQPGADASGASYWGKQGNDIYYNSGRVGIGTNTPGAGLEIKGSQNYTPSIGLNHHNGYDWRISSWSDSSLYFTRISGSTSTPLLLKGSNGYVGIGTKNPDQKLSVHSNSGPSYILVSDNTSGNTSGLRMGLSGSGNAYIINDESSKHLNFGTNGFVRAKLTSQGDFGINKLEPDQTLHIKHHYANRAIKIEHQSTTDNWEIGTGNSTKNFKFYYNDSFRADISSVDGGYTQSSDRRLKENIQSLNPVLDKVKQLEASSYFYKNSEDKSKKSIGFIAQDVEKLFPEIVKDFDDGYKGLTYDGFAVIAIKAIQEQQKIIEKLEKRIEELENK